MTPEKLSEIEQHFLYGNPPDQDSQAKYVEFVQDEAIDCASAKEHLEMFSAGRSAMCPTGKLWLSGEDLPLGRWTVTETFHPFNGEGKIDRSITLAIRRRLRGMIEHTFDISNAPGLFMRLKPKT